MSRRILIRVWQTFAVMLVMSVVVFALMGAMPGDPIDMMISGNPHLTPADVIRLKTVYGVGKPWPVRWADWAVQFAQGNLGYSRLFARQVSQIILPALEHTALLAVTAMSLALAVGIPLGIVAGAKPGSRRDRVITFVSYLSLSVPTFWLGLMLIALFSVRLGWLPASGASSLLSPQEGGVWDVGRHLLLPAATLAVGGAGQYIRHMRAAMIAESTAPYLRTARAKGCSPLRVTLNHHLRNALLPIVTIAALEAGALLSGALITETVFAWPGLGRLSYDAVMGNDYNLALTALLLATFLTLAASIIADLAYGLLDPRTRAQ